MDEVVDKVERAMNITWAPSSNPWHDITCEEYSIFGSTVGTTILSTLMMHPMKCLKDYIENNMCIQRHAVVSIRNLRNAIHHGQRSQHHHPQRN
jgi:hypothetical protein